MSSQSGNSFTRRRAAWREQVFDDIAELGPAGFAVAHAITRFLNSETFTAFPGRTVLAQTTNISIRAIQYALNKLEARGHLKISSPSGGISVLTPILAPANEPKLPPEKPKPEKPKLNSDKTGNGQRCGRTITRA